MPTSQVSSVASQNMFMSTCGNSEEGAPSFSSYLIINPILQLGFSLNSVFLEIFYPGSWSPSKYGQILCVWPALPGTRRAEKNVRDLR